jgi:hypothetical protein
MNKNSLQPDSEKKQNRFIFCCIGLILYTMPCMSCLMIPILTEGLTTPMIAALATVFAGVAAGFIGMNRFKAKKGRAIVILTAVILLALHILTAALISTWYIILSPELILLVLLVIWSDVVENR